MPLEHRDRLLVFFASVAPDLDGLSLLAGVDAYGLWHHVLLHNGLAALIYALATVPIAQRRLRVFALALFSYHLHMLCDFFGSAGPGGALWPIPYLVPFSFHEFYFNAQWELASWQNVLVTVLALVVCVHLGATRGRTLVEVFSLKADAAVVEVLRRRWPF